jgi:plasmid rolling circle replication initiator protein Rep
MLKNHMENILQETGYDNTLVTNQTTNSSTTKNHSKKRRIAKTKAKGKPHTTVEIYQDKKIISDGTARLYDAVDPKKAQRMRNCASVITTATVKSTGKMSIIQGQYCHLRLCAVCNYIEARKESFRAARAVASIINGYEDEYSTFFLTLTTKNCLGEDLKKTIRMQQQGFKKLIHKDGHGNSGPLHDVILGYVRCSEITITEKPYLIEQGLLYHPHIHVLIIVPRWYRDQICATEETLKAEIYRYSKLYRQACKLDYEPEVDLRETYGSVEEAALETVKYTLKLTEVTSVEILRVYDRELQRLRMYEYGGYLRAAYKFIVEQEEEAKAGRREELEVLQANGDLLLEMWNWNRGLKLYSLIKDTTPEVDISENQLLDSFIIQPWESTAGGKSNAKIHGEFIKELMIESIRNDVE